MYDIQWIQALAAMLGLAALLLVETAHPFFHQFRTGRERGVHAARNLFLGLVNVGLIAVIFSAAWVAAAAWAEARGFGALNLLGRAWEMPTWLRAGLAVLLLDAWTYSWHRLNHVVPFLWRFHQVHHADRTMDVTTASRFHAGEIILSSLLRIPLIIILGINMWELVAYEAVLLMVVQFHHANIALPPKVERGLRMVIVTPGMHKVHHSRLQLETDSNYASLFSFWDRLFASFRFRDRLEDIEFGLDEYADDKHDSLVALIRMPVHSERESPGREVAEPPSD